MLRCALLLHATSSAVSFPTFNYALTSILALAANTAMISPMSTCVPLTPCAAKCIAVAPLPEGAVNLLPGRSTCTIDSWPRREASCKHVETER